MKAILKKDIVIPAGTEFHEAAFITERPGDGHISAVFGLSNNTFGSIEYSIDPACIDEIEEYFQIKG